MKIPVRITLNIEIPDELIDKTVTEVKGGSENSKPVHRCERCKKEISERLAAHSRTITERKGYPEELCADCLYGK